MEVLLNFGLISWSFLNQNLGALYRRQGKYEAAETLEDCAMRSSSKHPLDLNRIRSTRRSNDQSVEMK